MRFWLGCAFAAVLGASVLLAEDGVLVLSVVDPSGKPLVGVTISTQGDGSSAKSDQNGKIRLKLPPGTPDGTSVAIVLIDPQTLRIISPYDRRTVVPKYRPGTDFVQVTLCSVKCYDAIKSDRAVAALLARINAASDSFGLGKVEGLKVTAQDTSIEARHKAASAVLAPIGIAVGDFDEAVDGFYKSSKDPYVRGMAALYRLEFDNAITLLGAASESATEAPDAVGNALFFSAQAQAAKGDIAKAAVLLDRADKMRPSNPLILNNWGTALIKDGKVDAGLALIRESGLILGSGRGGGGGAW